jgi:trehalose synthase-fused probable maltokinase
MQITDRQFESHVLPLLSGLIREQRWFGSKSKTTAGAALEDFSYFESGGSSFVLPVVCLTYHDGSSETYFVPLKCSEGVHSTEAKLSFQVRADDRNLHFSDALFSRTFIQALLSLMQRNAVMDFVKGRSTALSLPDSLRDVAEEHIRVVSSEQSNTSVMVGRKAIYKSYRKLEHGINPDFEIPEFLSGHTSFRSFPRPLGRLEYGNGGERALGVLSEFVENEGDCWTYFTGRLNAFLTSHDYSASCLGLIPALAGVTSSMHNALSGATEPAFLPSAVTEEDTDRWMEKFESLLHSTCVTLQRTLGGLSGEDRRLAELFLIEEDRLSSTGSSLNILCDESVGMTRIHGDYHLGQILKSGSSFYVIDFEGEPMRTLEERRQLNCPLKDVSGMIRSLDYAISAAAISAGVPSNDDAVVSWKADATESFMVKYWEAYSPSMPYLPSRFADMTDVLDFFLIEKTVYELDYELNNRPDWVHIPLSALASRSASQLNRPW